MPLGLVKWLLFLGIMSAITFFMPGIVLFLALTIIGIPIAIFINLSPLLFVFSLIGWSAYKILNIGRAGYAVGFLATLGALAIPPPIMNKSIVSRIEALVSDDHDGLSGRLAADALAIRRDKDAWLHFKEIPCDGECMRLLLNGQARRVLPFVQDSTLPLDPKLQVTSFRLDRGQDCPKAEPMLGSDSIYEKAGRGVSSRPGRAREWMLTEVAGGNCLIRESVPLSLANIVISDGVIHEGMSAMGAGLDLRADTVNARRFSVHIREQGSFREIYRSTLVVAHTLAPLLFPMVGAGRELRPYVYFARTSVSRNLGDDQNDRLARGRFLTDIKFDLTVDESVYVRERRQRLETIALQETPRSNADLEFIRSFIDSYRTMNIIERQQQSPDDLRLARIFLTDKRIPVSPGAWDWIDEAIRRGADASFFDSIAASMFQRLSDIVAHDDGKEYPLWRDEAHNITGALRLMPIETIVPDRDRLIWMTRQERLRVQVYDVLSRLGEFGPDMIPMLLWLMDESSALAKRSDLHFVDANKHWGVVRAGLVGLCKMGSAGKDAVQEIYQRVASDQIAKRFWEDTIHTLVNLGADPDQIWQHLETFDTDKTRRNFDDAVYRARNNSFCK